MAFHEIRFPANLSFGAMGGPERRTEIVALVNGFEARSTNWEHSRRRYDAGLGLRNLDDVTALIAFFEARRGQLHGFRWKDWADYRTGSVSRPIGPGDEILGAGDGEAKVFALRRTYRSGVETYHRPIAKPVAGTVQVAVGGIPLIEGVDWTLDPATGQVALTHAPAIGAEVTAGFEFDVPVRFDTDRIQTSVARFQAGEVPSVPVVEIRL